MHIIWKRFLTLRIAAMARQQKRLSTDSRQQAARLEDQLQSHEDTSFLLTGLRARDLTEE